MIRIKVRFVQRFVGLFEHLHNNYNRVDHFPTKPSVVLGFFK